MRARGCDMALLTLALCYMPASWLVDCKSLAHSMMSQRMKSNETLLIVFIQIQLTYVPICMSLLFICTVFVKHIVNFQVLWHRVALPASSLIEL